MLVSKNSVTSLYQKTRYMSHINVVQTKVTWSEINVLDRILVSPKHQKENPYEWLWDKKEVECNGGNRIVVIPNSKREASRER